MCVFSIEWISQSRSNNLTNERLTLSHILRLYKSLNLMNQLFNQIFSTLGTPAFFTLVTVLCVSTTFGCIRFYDEMNFIIYLFLPCLAVLAYSNLLIFSYVTQVPFELSSPFYHKFSGELAGEDKGGMGGRIILKELKSCRPLRICIGSHYVMKKNVKVICLSFIINACVYLLLA